MLNKKNEAGTLLPMTVTEGVTVNVLPNHVHEYLMTTKEVANGYGVTDYNVRQHKLQHSNELVEGKHFVIAVSIPNGELPSALKSAHNAVLWTKRGIVRLGFFIKSERAKLFRDWAEELIITVSDGVKQPPRRALPAKRNHNRLTPARMVDILADVCRIEDTALRLSITDKLIGKEARYGC
ncbi:MAG: hypothetical protein Q4G63_10615 [Bacteroidia bacterium]|nr:hypothetical protein [Bacteroidia bacterium]